MSHYDYEVIADLEKEILALAHIHEIIDEVYDWDEGYAIDELECKGVEEIAKTIQEYFGDGNA